MITFKHYLAEQVDLNVNPSAFRPTEHQRVVLSKIQTSESPQMAADQVARGRHFVAARNALIRLGFVGVVDGGLELTPSGEELIQAQALENPDFGNEMDAEEPSVDVADHTDNPAV